MTEITWEYLQRKEQIADEDEKAYLAAEKSFAKLEHRREKLRQMLARANAAAEQANTRLIAEVYKQDVELPKFEQEARSRAETKRKLLERDNQSADELSQKRQEAAERKESRVGQEVCSLEKRAADINQRAQAKIKELEDRLAQALATLRSSFILHAKVSFVLQPLYPTT